MNMIQTSFRVLFALIMLFGMNPSLQAQSDSLSPFDAVVKIGRLDKNLNLLDDFMGQDGDQQIGSPSNMLKGMLQGLDWIDSSRLIVLGIRATNEQATGFLLVPFSQENSSFQATFNARPGPDYYIVVLPPNPETLLAPAVESALAKISHEESKALLSIELATGNILEKNEQKIRQLFDQMLATSQNQKAEEFDLTPQEVQAMVKNLLETARQLKTFSFGFDVNQEDLFGFLEAVPVKESALSKIVASQGKTELLGAYRPNLSMNFRSGSFDIAGFYALFQENFGKLYDKLGISFSEFVNISNRFTGETAGGMSVEKDGIRFEMIAVLKEADKGGDFLEKVYLPWLIKYGEDLTKQMEKQLGTKIGNFIQRTTESTVSGRKVVGIKYRRFSLPATGDPKKFSGGDSLDFSEMRLATTGNFMLFAPGDSDIQRLIKVAGSLKEQPAKGSVISLDVDMMGYLEGIRSVMPDFPDKDKQLPKMGKAVTKIDFIDGKVRSTSSMRIADIKTLIDYLKKLTPKKDQPKPEQKTATPPAPKTTEKRPQVKKAEIAKKDANYWMKQGDLSATYGNDNAAIQYYTKAFQLDPKNSRILYQLGVSYGEVGQYKQAIAFIDKALALDTQNGRYYYGRGRVYLLSGDKGKAVEDFKRAAVLGDRDAQDYLRDILNMEWN